PRRRVLLVRNPEYFGRPPWADTVEVRLGVSSINACALIRRGLADGGFFEIPAAEYARLVNDPVWKPQLLVADAIRTEFLYMNVRQKPFDDVRVRQAVCWALDREAFVRVFSGVATIAGEFLPMSIPGARPLGRYLKRDVAKARALLAQAGYPNGIHAKLYGWTIEPEPRLLEVAQEQLAEAGIPGDRTPGVTPGDTTIDDGTNHEVA